MYRAVVFDFDYTLGDTTQSIAASVNYALGRLNYPPHSVEEIRKTIGFSLEIAFRMLTGERDEEKEKRFFDYFQIKADEVMTKDATLYPHTAKMLCKLRTWGIRIGVLSTKHRFRIEDIFKKYSLESVVDCIVGNEDVSREKPDPEGLFILLERFAVQREEMLYVGDSAVDAEAAKRAGVPFAAVLTGTTPRESFQECAAVASDLEELDKLLFSAPIS